jgi:hypothetical protein
MAKIRPIWSSCSMYWKLQKIFLGDKISSSDDHLKWLFNWSQQGRILDRSILNLFPTWNLNAGPVQQIVLVYICSTFRTRKKICLAKLTSQSDHLIVINWALSIKIEPKQIPNQYSVLVQSIVKFRRHDQLWRVQVDFY